MSFLLLIVQVISASVSANPFGMYNTMCSIALKMVPRREIHVAATKDKYYDIQAAFASENESLHICLMTKTIPCGDLQGDPRRRCADNQTTLSYIYPPTQGNAIPPRSSSVSFQFEMCLHSIRATAAHMRMLFARARIKQHAYRLACWDVLMDAQVAILDPLALVPVFGLLLVVGVCACAVCFDVALAVVGLMINIVNAPPTTHAHTISCFIKMCMHMITSRSTIKVMVSIYIITLIPCGLAAGRDTPAVNTAEYILPGVTRWDGIPFHDFRLVWWLALCAALGNISQDGWSLLQTARDQDIGGPAQGGTAPQRQQSQNRNQRLFGAMLNYIEPNSWVYRFTQRTFANNGRGLFNYLYVYGYLPYTSDERTEMENEWSEATMSTVGIKYTPEAVFKWAEYVDRLADKLNKSERDKRIKYLAGFPISFDVMIVPERARGAVGSYTHPANYPAHHPNAGDPHPQAGQPDINATALAFYSEWARMIRIGQIRSVPRGMANRIEDDDSGGESPEEHARMARERITSHTICGVCGGAGHAGNVDGLGACLTARLNHRVPNADLTRFQYPPGYSTPRFVHRSSSNRDSNRPRPHPRSNQPRSHERARVIEPPPSDESNDEHAHYMTRTRNPRTRDDARAPQSHPSPRASRSHPRGTSRNTSRSTRFNSRRHARQVEEEDDDGDNRDDTQNVNQDADATDDDEHARLAVSFETIEF